MRLSPLTQRTRLTPAEHEKATRLSREMALFTRLQGGASAGRPRCSPDSPAFARAARNDYAELLALHQAPKLPACFVVQKPRLLPAPVRVAIDTFTLAHPGRLEVAVSSIDGHRTWQAQVVQQGGAQVLLLDGRGHVLGRGVVRGAAVTWREAQLR